MNQLTSFLGSHARARLLAHFVAHPDSELHVRALERHTSLGKRSLQLELARLAEMGLIRRTESGSRVLYSRDGAHPSWEPLDELVERYAPDLVLADTLGDVPGIEAAFLFGSWARGDARDDSDLDLLVFGDEIHDEALGAALLDAALVLDRRIDVKRYDTQAFQRDLVAGASFLPRALEGPVQWLVGSVDRLPQRTAEEAA